MLLSLLTHNRDVHDEALGKILLLCFKLQEAKVSVVSSTAAATLRQAVILIFDRVSTAKEGASVSLELQGDHGEPGRTVQVTPSAADAFRIFADLCLLTAGGGTGVGISLFGSGGKERPQLLHLSGLSRTFGLELIESILSGYQEGVKQHEELLYLLQHSLDPLLRSILTDKATFAVNLRISRLMFLLVRSFIEQIPDQVEWYLLTLIRVGTGEGDSEDVGRKDVQPWQRGLALEVLRGISGDFGLLLKISTKLRRGDKNVFAKVVSALSRLVNERPVLLGVSAQMHGLDVPTNDSQATGLNLQHAGYLDMGVSMVSSAASAGISTVSSMIGASGGGLSGSAAPKVRLIDQHDKAEAPLSSEAYPYLLALQSLNAIADGIFTSVATQQASSAQVEEMARVAWPALLAALSFLLGVNLSDALFAEVLNALQNFTVACGLLQLATPRDAFLNVLEKFAVPPPVVSALQTYLEQPQSSRNNSVMSAENLGLSALGGGPTGPPGLSERNLACLKSTITVARTLAASLGPAWHDILEALQNANFILSTSKQRPPSSRRPIVASPSIGHPPSPSLGRVSEDGRDTRPRAFEDIDVDAIHTAINALFDSSRDLEDEAFTTFVGALCQLSSEMIGPTAASIPDTPQTPTTPGLLSPQMPELTRRRTSGINVAQTIKSDERSFSLTKLRIVAYLNLQRLVSRDPEVGWIVITQHLLSVARHPTAATNIRLQASESLSELLLAAIRIATDSNIQHQVFDVLVRQVDSEPVSHLISTDFDVRSSGFHTLNQILESSGHSLEVGWQTIFGMLNTVCRLDVAQSMSRHERSGSDLSVLTERRPSTQKGSAGLVRIAFPPLNLICTDFLSSLDQSAMRECIACLGHFGRQKDEVNIALSSIGLMWNVSDAIQSTSADLWLTLLVELLELGRDPRLEVRSGAMQTLFRCLELYGRDLSKDMWEDVLVKVVFPLLDTAKGDESAVLALTSAGSVLGQFFPQITALPSFASVSQQFLDRIEHAFTSEPRDCTSAALKAFERVLQAALTASSPAGFVEKGWKTLLRLGEHFESAKEPYTQDNLIILVRIAALLQVQVKEAEDRARALSGILRQCVTYTKSPDNRPDVDIMSPLQTAVSDMVATSTVFAPSIILSDLAEFASLAYTGDTSSKLSFVALAKSCMPKLAKIMLQLGPDASVYSDGTIGNVLGAYAVPIKLKYDCPAPSKYGNDPPLWKTAMSEVLPIVEASVSTLAREDIPMDTYESVWSIVTGIFASMLLADNTSQPAETNDEAFVLPLLDRFKTVIVSHLSDDRMPPRISEQLANTLRKASVLYRYEVDAHDGTSAPVVAETSEEMRYWALDMLVALASPSPHKEDAPTAGTKLVNSAVPALLERFEQSLRHFVADTKLRGQMPLGRVREEELLYILRQLSTMRVAPGSVPLPPKCSPALEAACKTSDRAHLLHFYPLLLELGFLAGHLPSMWIFPSEYRTLLSLSLAGGTDLSDDSPEARVNGMSESEREGAESKESDGQVDAGDGGDLIEVSARDIARRCLELLGEDLGLVGGRQR